MKVIYAVNSDLGKHGTIGFRTFHVALEAHKKGCLKKIICRGNFQNKIPQKYIQNVFPFYRVLNLGMSVISQYLIKKFPARQLQIWIFDYFCSKKLEKADVLHTYEYAPRTMRKAKEMGMKVILDAQMAHPREADRIFNLKRHGLIKKHSKIANMADVVIAPSGFVAESYKKEVLKGTKIITVPFGVDINRFKPSKSKNKEFTCLFVGVIEPRKGIDYLMKAWKEMNLKDSKLILCGRINKTMAERVKKYKEYESVEFTGHVNPVKYYQKAHVFVFPSLFEGSAKAVYEAMASGLPIITTYNSGPPFKDGEAGFIIPIKDAKSIEKKILYLKNNAKTAKKMGEKARKIAKDYTWEIYGNKIEKLYKSILVGRDASD